MTILLVIFLGISFICAVTLVSACKVSGRIRNASEERTASEGYDEQHAINPTVSSLHTTTPAAS
jgi:hypothetical protein